MTFLVLLAVVAGVALRAMTADERRRLLHASGDFARRLWAARSRIRPCEPLRTNLRARTRRVFVAPATIVVMCGLYVTGSADAYANIGPQTTAGEWWRVMSAVFAHSSLVYLIVNIVGFAQPALLLERLVGHTAVAAVFVAAGVTSGVARLSANPVGVNLGASGAICGVYGLLAVAILSGAIRRSPVTIPFLALKRLAPAAALFFVYHIATDRFGGPEQLGLAMGLGCGGILAFRLGERKPPARRIAAAMSAVSVLAIGSAVSIGGIVDVRPEMAYLVALEERTANSYTAAVDRFRQGRIHAEALAKLIEQTIVPELQAARERLSTLQRVPPEQKPLVEHAEEYLRLRGESWRLRSDGLRTTNMLRLRQAERTERASLSALQKIKATNGAPAAL